MARQVVLDTETTGLNAKLGDRVVEIGCVEILGRRIGEQQFHAYVNPEREIDPGASRVHGLTLEDLKDKPKFAEIAREFLDFIRGAELVIHNAGFDVEFLDLELGRVGLGAGDVFHHARPRQRREHAEDNQNHQQFEQGEAALRPRQFEFDRHV